MSDSMRQEELWRERHGLAPDKLYSELRQEELQKKLEDKQDLTKGERYEVTRMVPRPSGLSSQDVLMALMVLKLSKTDKGLEVLKVVGKEFVKGIFDTLHALGQASAANKIAAWANPYLVNNVLDRFGFVRTQGSSEFKVGLSIIAGAAVAEGYVDTLQGIFPWTKPEDSEFPSSIVYSARTEGDTVKEEITAKGASTKDVKALRKLLANNKP